MLLSIKQQHTKMPRMPRKENLRKEQDSERNLFKKFPSLQSKEAIGGKSVWWGFVRGKAWGIARGMNP